MHGVEDREGGGKVGTAVAATVPVVVAVVGDRVGLIRLHSDKTGLSLVKI